MILSSFKVLALICVTLCFLAKISAQKDVPAKKETDIPEVLVVGVYHMANPGQDIFNTKVDDVLTQKRQKEMEEVLAVLQKFKPTKIAVEQSSQRSLDQRYTKYLAGEYTLTANEVDQIGLRLAKMLGLSSVCACDADGDFPFPRLQKYAKATDRSVDLDEIMNGGWGAMAKQQTEFLRSHSILETLRFINSDQNVARDVGLYYRLAHFGEPFDFAGPDLLAEWYRRNLRIFNNVTKLAERSDERILVIFGAGHLGWLRQAFEADPTFRLRKLDEYVPKP
ncbi:DUF5694 domain-containing protein [Leptolyngbya sp. 7M]|uniref:DUF5694 domain-containing protein n=1 Tax=Leptolyngbya sp. 7M TaxID=2812896 RepID=UPI001B8BA9BB|nr:DUF5694 domain-containing protein [Leptolyngbya sp. 7M]QYO68230.1 hypothetical protein JVX88_16565 [Leptolyngbya sp. 7M]